ncbi:MAG: sulfur carrier protein ThiS [Bacteroidia bacterium]
MQVFINKKAHQTAQATLNDLLTEIQFATTRGIAVAVNDKVISKSQWADFLLSEADKITIIRATQGG